MTSKFNTVRALFIKGVEIVMPKVSKMLLYIVHRVPGWFSRRRTAVAVNVPAYQTVQPSSSQATG